MAHQTDLPDWALWRPPVAGINLRHAVRTLRGGASFEDLVLEGAASAPPLDRSLQRYQREHPKMGRNDRLVLGTAVYHLARNRALLRPVGRELPGGEGQVLLLALLDAVGTQGALGEIRHLPGGVRPWRQRLAVLGRERARLAAIVKDNLPQAVDGLSGDARSAIAALYSVPEWWLDRGPWQRVGEAVTELSRLRTAQQLTLRVQAHRGVAREQALAELEALQIPAGPTSWSPWGIVVAGRHNVLATEPYRSGLVEVQDEGSQLIACLCDPKPRETVLDLCAGAGGKTLALASAMGGRGTVIAYDIAPKKLNALRTRARRAGLGNIRAVEELGRAEELGPYDLVLADVPCSSTGTLRRNPDAAWRWGPEHLRDLVATQRQILRAASHMVRPGGVLVYATCSLFEEENNRQIRWFLDHCEDDFEPAPPGDRALHRHLPASAAREPARFRLAADLADYSGDGFFVARLRKRARE